MPTAYAKLGDTEAESRKRFGTSYKSLPNMAGVDFRRRYHVSEGFYVDSFFLDGRVVAEVYYGDLPTESGHPPAAIWKGVRDKNVPAGKWVRDTDSLYKTADGRYVSVGLVRDLNIPGERYAISVMSVTLYSRFAQAESAELSTPAPIVAPAPRAWTMLDFETRRGGDSSQWPPAEERHST